MSSDSGLTARITITPVLAEDAQNKKMSEIERTIAVQRATQVAIWAVPAVATYPQRGHEFTGKIGKVTIDLK